MKSSYGYTIQIRKKVKELKDKEHEIELLRRKIMRGEVGGNGAPIMLNEIQSEVNQLKEQLKHLTNRKHGYGKEHK
jgi:hypothetical protein